MKQYHSILFGAALAVTFSCSAWAQSEPGATPKAMGAEKTSVRYIDIELKNLQDEPLGRIVELGLDLVNGRIVEVLVKCDGSLDVGSKIVGVPPLALVADPSVRIYRLNVSREVFRSAAGIDMTKWTDYNRSDRVAAAYRVFGQDPYFLEEGDTASTTARRPKVSLGYVERASKIQDMPVGNNQGVKFGKVWSLTMNILTGRILNVIVLAPGNFETKSLVPALALDFNPARDALLLDDTVEEFADEPRYLYTEGAFGNEANSQQELYKGLHTRGPLVQGSSYTDIDRTAAVFRGIRATKVNARHVEVATNDGRVTLRGWADNAGDKRKIMAAAVAASRVEIVDDQITVGRPVAVN